MIQSAIERLLAFLEIADDIFWVYIGVPALIGLGLYFSFKSGWFQIFKLHRIGKLFYSFATEPEPGGRGVPPLHAFFASIGGTIGIGNVVAVSTAVQLGGPGAVFWMWVAALVGMLVKYAEIYLGIQYRVKNNRNSYDGGPMIYLQHAFGCLWPAKLFCVFLFVYGVEIYVFKIIAHSVSTGWNINYSFVVLFLLAAIIGAGKGGVRLVGKVSTIIIPIFLVGFTGMSFWVLFNHIGDLPAVFASIFKSAFNGHAAVGAFAGSGVLLTTSHGVRRACYSGDLGIGYASIIHSESEEARPEKQAALGIFGIFLDTFIICTLSLLVILVTGVWDKGIHEGLVVALALGKYFPHVQLVWPFFIFLLGYSSLIAYFAAGRKAARFLFPRYGAQIFLGYALAAFLFFAYVGTESQALTVMSLAGIFLLVLNVLGIYKLRKEIKFRV